MDKKSKNFIKIFFIIVMLSITISAYIYLYKHDYIVFISEDSIPAQTDIRGIINLK